MKELFGTLEELIHHARETPGQLLFRGQSSARFDLRPSIGRPHPRYKPNARIEKNLLEQFRLKSRAYRNSETSKLDSLILARHYGLRTRLLDWTSSIYTALYFAIEQRRTNEIFPISIPDERLIGIPIEKNKSGFGRIFGYSKELDRIWLYNTRLNKVQEYSLNDSFLRKLQIPLKIVDAFFPSRDITFIRKKSKAP
jgi:hypothetical protein